MSRLGCHGRGIRMVDAILSYLSAQPDLAPASVARMRHNMSRWRRVVGVDLPKVTAEDLAKFRQECLKAKLSPWTIESTITDVRLLASHLGHHVPLGKRLKRPEPAPVVPTLEQVELIYQHADACQWPRVASSRGGRRCLWLHCRGETWWRAWLVAVCWWGFRLRDIRAITLEDIAARQLRAKKTAKVHPLCVPPFVERHFRELSIDAGPAFGPMPPHQVRRELGRISAAAGVPYVSPHGFRRFAIQSWSAASSEAGRIIHGSGLGVLRHYLDAGRVLQDAAAQVVIPTAWLTPKELSDRMRGEKELLHHFRRAPAPLREAMLRIARAV